ncbi:TetR/AcrR family transcriptional regulator [Candidatus Saccharibacteria bacterium]|nr:TetR/AcrR family transcriptional regulator [Candidatus Saccharibacteria bacterium]NIV71807.1 TetR family transcriptional regulator [Calditrichia bacterium]NIW78777.1 TetR family transcriptional regulator [Calditrichia bacterium]
MRLNTEERQKQIIDEAIKIIHQQGYTSLAIRELAKHVGISEPAIYRHFESKEEIIAGILQRMVELGNTVKHQLKDLSDPRKKIEQFILAQLDYLEKHPAMTSVIFSENIFQHNDRLKSKLQKIVNLRSRLISQILSEARQHQQLADATMEDLIVIIMGSVRMTVIEWRQANFSYSLRKRGQHLIATIEKLIFKS